MPRHLSDNLQYAFQSGNNCPTSMTSSDNCPTTMTSSEKGHFSDFFPNLINLIYCSQNTLNVNLVNLVSVRSKEDKQGIPIDMFFKKGHIKVVLLKIIKL